MVGPSFQQVELPLTQSSGQNMSPALKNERPARIEADRGIRAIQLFLDDQLG
jgi:hypothetical protein